MLFMASAMCSLGFEIKTGLQIYQTQNHLVCQLVTSRHSHHLQLEGDLKYNKKISNISSHPFEF